MDIPVQKKAVCSIFYEDFIDACIGIFDSCQNCQNPVGDHSHRPLPPVAQPAGDYFHVC